MKRPLSLSRLVIATFLLAACGTRATAAPSPTDVPATNTPPVVATVAPSATLPAPTTVPPTEVPATPNPGPQDTPTAQPEVTVVPATPVPTTPDPNQGVGAVIFEDSLNGRDGWGWSFSDEAAEFGAAGDELQAVMHDPDAWWRFTIGPALALGDQQVQVTTHTVACAANDEYALMFRASETAVANQYQAYIFKLRCDGAARLDRLDGTQSTTLVDWTVSDAIRTGAPADNTLLVWMMADEFRFFVNDQYLFDAHDATLADGTFGFYVDDQTSGGLTVNFEDLTARGTESVTGN